MSNMLTFVCYGKDNSTASNHFPELIHVLVVIYITVVTNNTTILIY